nr:sulfite exporter TauE/SafE family protein [Aliarcobacter butzleri]
MEAISIITIISIAFLGSFGHCVGMCGGIVIAYSSTKIKNEYSKKLKHLHIYYTHLEE